MKNIGGLLILSLSLILGPTAFAAEECLVDKGRLVDIEGSYEGVLRSEDKEIPIRISFIAVTTTGGADILKGFYERLDVGDVLDLTLDVEHCLKPDSAELKMIGRGPWDYGISIAATASELMLAGQLRHVNKGPNGTFVLEKK